ncbi:MAG: YaaL family protein [Clostridia bacterium]|nr:YaaL family protein [Clostridia bacterium]
MQEEFVKEELIIDKSEYEKDEEIIKNIIKAKRDLENAQKNFEYAQNQDLVDYYIYQIKSNQSKIDYLIKLAKAKGIFVNLINEAEIKLEDRAG